MATRIGQGHQEKNRFLTIAGFCGKWMMIYGVMNTLETPFLGAVKAHQVAQTTFRTSLQNQSGFSSRVKKVYSYFIGSLLKIPIIRVIVLSVSCFFPTGTRISADQKKNLLWAQQEVDKLVAIFEEEMNSAAGISWGSIVSLINPPALQHPVPRLSRFARDLTLEAARGELRPFFGREKIMHQLAEIVGRNQKSNPILLGPPGVGKSSIPEGIAQSIVKKEEKLSPVFQGKRIFLLQWDHLAAGVEKYTGDTLRSRLMGIVKEASENKNSLIVFIDEIHAFLKSDSDEIMGILKPALADGSISCIAATTTWDYQRMLEKDPSLERRFPQVQVTEPTDEELRLVLQGVIPRLEAHHGVHISDQAIEECINLGKRYLKSQSFPDKAIDLLDQAASRLSLSQPSSAREKQLSLFLKILVFMQGQIDKPSQLDQKIKETREKFSPDCDRRFDS